MADQPWDVFVSYAHADDEPPMGAAKGWVTTLADELRKVLRRKLGVREARIFMDHQLAGNKGLTDGLLDTVRGSRTLLLLMSPGYRKSSWCQWELGRFLEAQTERNHRDHVFVLETEPLDRAGWHPALQELIPIRFWHREFEDKAPRLMGFPVPTLNEDNPYWRNLNELAHLIARQLESVDAPSQEPRAKVWLAEPTEDLLEEHESVAATLRQQGFQVVPAAHLPQDGREPYLRALQVCLDQAILGVQLLGPREGRRPAWGDRSFVALQAAAADEAVQARGLRVLRWRSRDVDLDRVTSADYRALLTGGGVLAQGIEEFKQEILRACATSQAKATAPVGSPGPPHPGDAPHVYVNAEAVDRDLGRRLLDALAGFGMLDGREVKAPYPGLRPFAPYETKIFFGREAHTDRLLEILRRERFLAVLGPSGAGKSSLVRAGLLPGLAAGWLGGASDWRIAVLRPGERPFRRLAEELVRPGALGLNEGKLSASALSSVPGIEAELRRGPLGLVHLVADARRGEAGASPFKLLILVDQFEEIFRYAQAGGTAADESEAFVNLLLASRAEPEAGIYVALTMRTDFLGHCVRFLELPEAINRAQYLTPRLTRTELERAITGPALVFGGDVAPELVAELINSLGQDFDQLPLLQHALARMWITKPVKSGTPPLLTAASLEALGGLQGALSSHAEEIFGKLSAGEQALAETLFRCITLREGTGPDARSTRRPQRLKEIADVAECDWQDLEPVVRSFAAEGANFLHYGEPLGPESVIDISHEALIRQWERLRTWAEDEARRAAELLRWRDRAAQRHERKGELLTGADLSRAVEWRDDQSGRIPKAQWADRYLGSAEEIGFSGTLAFIAKSEAAENERQEQEAFRAKTQEQLERSALEARAEANRAKAEAAARERDQAQGHAKRSRRLSLAALAAAVLALIVTGVAGTFYLRAKEAAKEALARQLASEATYRSELEPDRAQLLVVEAFKTSDLPVSNVAVRQTYSQFESLLHTLRGHEGPVWSAVFSPDGGTVLTSSNDNTARLWDATTGKALRTLRGHEGSVLRAVFSQDGRTVLTASEDNTVRLWDAATGKVLRTLRGHEDSVLRAVFSQDGRTVLTTSRDDTVRLWDAATGLLLQTLRGDGGSAIGAVFSADGKTVLTTGFDMAWLWDAVTGRPLRTLQGYEGSSSCEVFSANGRTVLTASSNTAQLWDTTTGQRLQTFRGHESMIVDAVFSADGKTLLTSSGDNTARLWDTATGQSLQILRGHEGWVRGAVFSPDGKTVLTASGDNTARLWHTATGQTLQIFRGHETSTWSAVFSPDGRRILTAGDNTARLWNAASGQSLQTLGKHDYWVSSAVLSRDGRTILTASDDGTARLWDAATGQTLRIFRGHKASVASAAFSPDGRTALTASNDKTARLWNMETGRPLRTLQGHKNSVDSAVFSPNGRTVLTVSIDNTAWLWDADTGRPLRTLHGHESSVDSALFSADGRTVLTASEDKTTRLWDAATGRPLKTFRGHMGPVVSAVFSPDGRTVLTASEDKTARLWDAATGHSLKTFRGHKGRVASAVFSLDGRTVLTAGEDQTARLWDVASGRPLQIFRGHEGSVYSAIFSADGRTVLTSGGFTAQLWDTATGRPLQTLRGPEALVVSAVFSSDGRTILTASYDKTARLWPCNVCRPTRELADEILRRVGRQLTPEERAESGLPPLP